MRLDSEPLGWYPVQKRGRARIVSPPRSHHRFNMLPLPHGTRAFRFAPLLDPRAADVVDAMRDRDAEGGPDQAALVAAIGAYLAGLPQQPPRTALLAALFQMADVIDASRNDPDQQIPLTRLGVAQAAVAVYDALGAPSTGADASRRPAMVESGSRA